MNKEYYTRLVMQANDAVIAEFTGRSVDDVSYHASQGTLGDIIAAAYDEKKPAERTEFLQKHYPDALVEQAPETKTQSKRGGKRR